MFKFFSKNIVEDIRNINSQEFLKEYLPYLFVLDDDKTIITKNNTLIRVIKIGGVDSSNSSAEEKEELNNIRNNFLSIVDEKMNLSFYTMRRKISDVEAEESIFTNKYATKIVKKWNTQFEGSYFSVNYLVITQNFSSLSKDFKKLSAKISLAKKEMDFRIGQIMSSLNKFSPVEVKNGDDRELFRFFSYLINGYEFLDLAKFHQNSPSVLLNNLSLSDFSFNSETGLIKIRNDRVLKFSKIIGVRVASHDGGGICNYSDENLLRILLTLNYEFTCIQQIKTYNKSKIISDFTEQKKSLEQLPRLSVIQSRIEELDIASELVESGNDNFLDYSFYIKVFGNSEEELDEALSEIQNKLTAEGISSISETISNFTTFFSLLPDYRSFLDRLKNSIKSRIRRRNASDYISLTASKSGFRRSPFGEMPVVNFKTIDVGTMSHSGNYGFTFHQDDISDRSSGHTIVIGGTGTGKSTLMAFLLMNSLKFHSIKILAFDSLEGLKIPITAFDGKYITVGKDEAVKLNPMKMPSNFANRNFQKRFISMLAGGIEEGEEEIIEEVIRQNYVLDEEDRLLKNLQIAFGLEGFDENKNRPAIASRIKKWVGEDSNAKFFNNNEDNLDFTSNIVAFDMAQILKDQELLAPTSFYIFHKFSQIIGDNPSPHIFFIDEMQKYLQNKEFNPHIITTIKESRKRNGIFVGCMQEASTLVEDKNGDEIISNIATFIIFPNSQAKREHYQEGLGLTDAEFNFIKGHPNPRHVLVKKKDSHSVIIDADLAILDNYLKLFSSKDTDRKRFEELLENNEAESILEFIGGVE